MATPTWRASDALPLDDEHSTLIVIPTVATPSVLLPTLDRLVETVDGERVRIVVSVNPKDPKNARRVLDHVERMEIPENVRLDVHIEDGLRGFGGAANIGIRSALRTGGLPRYIVIFNDDLVPLDGWLSGCLRAFEAREIAYPAENPQADGNRPRRAISSYGRIGLVGPVGNNVAGYQQVASPEQVAKVGYERLALRQREQHGDEVWAAEFVSGFCMLVSRECLAEIAHVEGDEWHGLFDADRYPVAGYEDNDLCVRVDRAGWRAAIAMGAFIGHLGHQTFDNLFPDWLRGMRNRLAYYRKWRGETSRRKSIGAVYRVRLASPNDLHLWMASLARSAEILDGVAVLLTGNPLDVIEHASWRSVAGQFSEREHEFLRACSGVDADGVASATRAWIEALLAPVRAARVDGAPFEVRVETWSGAWNERDERNRAIEIAEGVGFDWLLSTDHDEIVEDRITRALLDRWLAHPDPLVESYEVAWVNHWENSRMVRVDRPWGDGGTYRGGMMGPRLWRVNKRAPKRVTAGTEIGLHCGNSPLVVPPARKVASLRFRHYGYVDRSQRARKFAFYSEIDPSPDRILVGGETYGHILADENMVLRPFVARNGIGLSMLLHAGETVHDVGRWLDDLYTLVDAVVLVWTDEWREEDRSWVGRDPDEVEEWPETGPSRDLAYLAWVFGAEWTHHRLDDDLADARNAGFERLRAHPARIGWGLFVDPDEWTNDYHAMARGIRCMAETSDGWGWLFKFSNLLRGSRPTYSESVRLFRLDDDGVMRLTGRVHEGFDKAIEGIRERGQHPNFRYAPFTLMHGGLAKGDAVLGEKLARYRRSLLRSLDEEPFSPGAWVSLGLQYLNDGDLDRGRECFERGMLCAGSSYLPFKEAAWLHLRLARGMLERVVDLTVAHHPTHALAADLLETLREIAPPLPIVGSSKLPPVDLPAFPIERLLAPEDAEAIVASLSASTPET